MPRGKFWQWIISPIGGTGIREWVIMVVSVIVVLITIPDVVAAIYVRPAKPATPSAISCQELEQDSAKVTALIERDRQTVATFQEMLNLLDDELPPPVLTARQDALEHGTVAVHLEQEALISIGAEIEQQRRQRCIKKGAGQAVPTN